MKQLFICQNKAYSTAGKAEDLTTVEEGAIALFDLVAGTLLSAAPTNNFSIAVGRGADKMPLYFPEVDLKSLSVSKASYQAGSKYKVTVNIGTPVKGEHYTIVVVKKGTVFNERSNWTFTTMAKSTTAADVAAQLVSQINANKYQLGVTASNSGGTITIEGIELGKDFEVYGADTLLGVTVTLVAAGQKAMCDKAYVQDLASRCAAGKGFNYLGEDGKEIYPGYPEVVADDEYSIYTLRFAVSREASKQRDEVVYQIVHIAVPVGAGAEGTLDGIFGTTSTASVSE